MKRILSLAFLVLYIPCAFGQEMCQVSGIVRYQYNDYIGYRTDLGAEVYFIPKTPNDTIPHLQLWEEYETIAHRGIMYNKYISEAKQEGYYSDIYETMMKGNWDYNDAARKRVDELDAIVFKEKSALLENDDNVALVDNSGLYTISLPKGEYYVVFVSANRRRSSWISEITGRIHITSVDLKGASKKLSYDFDY